VNLALLERWRDHPVERDLRPYQQVLQAVNDLEGPLHKETDDDLGQRARTLKQRVAAGQPLDEILPETFALAREAARRVLGQRPFDVQVLAAVALHRNRIVEMRTGEGKTLAAVLPLTLNALDGKGAHLLTFNDYLAQRDAEWMGPVYHFLGLEVGYLQQDHDADHRRRAYAADITYATAKEVGFDFLRAQLCRSGDQRAQRGFSYAIVDEADSILIDEARVPLVIAGRLGPAAADPGRLAAAIDGLEAEADYTTDGVGRNVFLTDEGLERLEAVLGCPDLHAVEHIGLLTRVHQALHAAVLLRRDRDYIVRQGRVEIVDEFTGRVVEDRHWPHGLQAAVEAKEGLVVQDEGEILGSIALQYFLQQYPGLAGMTATAAPAAEELREFYGRRTVVIPPHWPPARIDHPDRLFTHREAKVAAVVAAVVSAHAKGRPVLAGTASVAESETLHAALQAAGVACKVLNAKTDASEARIIAGAGAPGAVTIATNLAGRGTDIRLGGADGHDHETVVRTGGLYVIGTSRHESRRIDDQLRGRAGRQGDPGSSRFFVSLEDDLMQRHGVRELIPAGRRPPLGPDPIDDPLVRREADRVQRIVEGQNFEIRRTLWRYTGLVEAQRRLIEARRDAFLDTAVPSPLLRTACAARYAALEAECGAEVVRRAERDIALYHTDRCWADYLAWVAGVRESIHLVTLGGQDPLDTFRLQVSHAFEEMEERIRRETVETFEKTEITSQGIDVEAAGLRGPSSTWTYQINDRFFDGLRDMFLQNTLGNSAGLGLGMVQAWPLVAYSWLVQWWKRRGGQGS
jgi:preprotein translocase subunit SecA